MSILIKQKLVENAKIENLKCDILGDFQTMWSVELCEKSNFYLNLVFGPKMEILAQCVEISLRRQDWFEAKNPS